YKKKLSDWETKEKEITGSIEKEGSIENLKNIVKYLENNLARDLQNKRDERLNKSLEIFDEKEKLKNKYKELYIAIEKFIDENKEIAETLKIKFDATLNINDFESSFLDYIHQNRSGSFFRDENDKIKTIIDKTNFNEKDSLKDFLINIINHLEYDKRNENEKKLEIKSQIKQGKLIDFYNFLFSLRYLEPSYKLKMDDKELSTLSPGERGASLLIFYLFLDKDNIPLIIDQPEENMDNQSVYKLLVKNIKEAKKRRQIIIVTHNPNLAVVCDAEQIIHAQIDKADGNKVTYRSGAIENPYINGKIVEILEGTLPAFKNRDSKYSITKSLNKNK
ncbi:MAG: ATP-binding protein, partial [Spirochaetota bacterium]|nr:ATP-binding protein [Spirochaetota bacterium]